MDVKPIMVHDTSVWMVFVQGLMAFFSPCVIPLIPFFISVLMERKCVSRICLFATGFCASFTLMGATSGILGGHLESRVFSAIAGALLITLSVLYTMDVRVMRSPVRLLEIVGGESKLSGLILGAVVGMIWIPCSTPALAGALVMASLSGTALKGAFLLFVYSLGILVPLLILGNPISELFNRLPEGWKKALRFSIGAFMAVVGFGVMTGYGIFYR